jgi:hypothetical protein
MMIDDLGLMMWVLPKVEFQIGETDTEPLWVRMLFRHSDFIIAIRYCACGQTE